MQMPRPGEETRVFRWLLEPMLETCGFEIVGAESGRRLYRAYTCRQDPVIRSYSSV
jgi:hypothetical protein